MLARPLAASSGTETTSVSGEPTHRARGNTNASRRRLDLKRHEHEPNGPMHEAKTSRGRACHCSATSAHSRQWAQRRALRRASTRSYPIAPGAGFSAPGATSESNSGESTIRDYPRRDWPERWASRPQTAPSESIVYFLRDFVFVVNVCPTQPRTPAEAADTSNARRGGVPVAPQCKVRPRASRRHSGVGCI